LIGRLITYSGKSQIYYWLPDSCVRCTSN